MMCFESSSGQKPVSVSASRMALTMGAAFSGSKRPWVNGWMVAVTCTGKCCGRWWPFWSQNLANAHGALFDCACVREFHPPVAAPVLRPPFVPWNVHDEFLHHHSSSSSASSSHIGHGMGRAGYSAHPCLGHTGSTSGGSIHSRIIRSQALQSERPTGHLPEPATAAVPAAAADSRHHWRCPGIRLTASSAPAPSHNGATVLSRPRSFR